MRTQVVSLAVYWTLFLSGTRAFWRLPCDNTVTVERLDPVISPNAISGHVHTVVGGSSFSQNATYDTMRASTCTSCAVKQDMSAYWVPQLYIQFANNTFLSVPQTGGILVYYLQRTGSAGGDIQAFPPGFRMVAGNPMLRSYNETAPEQIAINYVCLTYTTNQTAYYGPALPSQTCPDGLRAQVFFPSCWDGHSLDSPDHKSHMAYPDGVNTGNCPASHPVRLISLFYEVTFAVAAFDGYRSQALNPSQPFVWAMGDPTGYGFHGDFLNGWDQSVLQTAINTCTDDSGVIEDCSVFDLQDYNTDCHKTPTVNETVLNVLLKKLPGCNPVNNGPAAATGCADTSPPSLFSDPVGYTGPVAPIGSQGLAGTPQVVPSGSGYTYSTCWSDKTSSLQAGRTLPNGLTVSGDMTVEKCLAACQTGRYAYCGLEYGQECWAANTLAAGSASIALGNCSMPCKGSSSEYCGGASALSLYKLSSSTPSTTSSAVASPSPTLATNTKPTNGTFLGCYTDNVSGRALNAVRYTPANLTVQTCIGLCAKAMYKYAGVEYSGECYCDNVISGGNTIASPSSDPLAAGCSMACSGSKYEACGGSNRLDVYANNQYVPTVTNPGAGGSKFLGCYTEVSGRTLSAKSESGSTMTVSTCVSFCSSAGYSYAGVEYGAECYCANTIASGSSIATPASNPVAAGCNMHCSGNATEYCGGPNRLNLYSLAAATNTKRTASTAKSSKKGRDI